MGSNDIQVSTDSNTKHLMCRLFGPAGRLGDLERLFDDFVQPLKTIFCLTSWKILATNVAPIALGHRKMVNDFQLGKKGGGTVDDFRTMLLVVDGGGILQKRVKTSCLTLSANQGGQDSDCWLLCRG